jgi:hypothetical protein
VQLGRVGTLSRAPSFGHRGQNPVRLTSTARDRSIRIDITRMSIAYNRDRALKRIVVGVSGEVSMDDLIAVVNRQAADDAWEYALLYDLRDAPVLHVDADDIRRLVEYVRSAGVGRAPRGPVAVVATEPAHFGLARMYSMLAEDARLEVEVFRTLEEAEQWLASRLARRAS